MCVWKNCHHCVQCDIVVHASSLKLIHERRQIEGIHCRMLQIINLFSITCIMLLQVVDGLQFI